MTSLTSIIHRVVSNPWVYDGVQRLLGARLIASRLAPLLAQAGGGILLDVGAGTGNFLPLLPDSATYLWLDNDPQKLEGFRKKWPAAAAVLGDGTRICLKDASVGYALCVCVSHHLSDTQLAQLMAELARVARRGVIFVDAVKCSDSKISDLLWRYDRGSYPRSMATLHSYMERFFEVKLTDSFAAYHQYVLCQGRPRRKAA